MSDAVVRVNLEGAWQPVAPVWSLSIDGDDHGPSSATFVCKQRLPKNADVEILIGGLLVADGWVEQAENMDDGEGLHTVTVWCWQRHLDEDVFYRLWFLSGFERAVDARDAIDVSQSYWARSTLTLADRSLTIGLQPNTIWYTDQAAGATFDLGPMSAVGPTTINVLQSANNLPSGFELVARAHSLRGKHHPLVVGQGTDAFVVAIGGGAGNVWHSGTFAANFYRYVTVFVRATVTHDLAKTAAESYTTLSDIRISTLGAGGGTAGSFSGYSITADMAVPAILQPAGLLTLRRNVLSSTDIYGLVTDGQQTPRQVLERINLDQWRYRVNPGRFFDREPYPTRPAYTVLREARSRLRTPETYTAAVVPFRDQQGDEDRVRLISNPDRPRAQVIQLDSNATAAQAEAVANAFLTDQAQRRIEGTVTVAPGQIVTRPSGEPIDPAQLLLAGGERVWLDEAGDHARIARMDYNHDARTMTLDLTEPNDDLDRELAYLSEQPS
jgi:hypothetical protein